jgi:hypothetical protein
VLALRTVVNFLRTVVNFETGDRRPIRTVIGAIRKALEDAGIEFIAQNGGGPGGGQKQSKK